MTVDPPAPVDAEPIQELRAIAERLNEVGRSLRVPSQRGPLIGAWTTTLGGMSEACEGLANLLETVGREDEDEAPPNDTGHRFEGGPRDE